MARLAYHDALIAAGVREQPPHVQRWIAERLERSGLFREARNLGGLCCTLPHQHDTGECVAVPTAGGVRHLAVFRSLEDAARCLVATARRASAPATAPEIDLPAVGYTSTHPMGDEVAGAALPPAVAQLVSGWFSGPSAEAEGVFRGLLADWESYEREGVPDKRPELALKETHAAWVRFRDQWLKGDGDVTNLNPMVADSNRVRRTLLEAAGRLKPGELPPDLRQGIDIENASEALKAAAEADKEAAKFENDPLAYLHQLWKRLPIGVKVAAGVAGAAGLAYASAPMVLALTSLRGRTTVVVQKGAR